MSPENGARRRANRSAGIEARGSRLGQPGLVLEYGFGYCIRYSISFTEVRAEHSSHSRFIAPNSLPGAILTFSERLQEIRTGFERPFWVANITEIFERLSYYAAFASLALYLQEKLNFSTEQTGTLTGLFGGMVWFLTIFGGAAADRIGFRRALSMAYLILAAAYFLIGSIAAPWLAPVRNHVPLVLFVGCILSLPALGVALVKPCVVGTTARSSKENVRSIGYSIYYTMVNIGGAAGPYFASWVHRHLGVENVYRVAAISVFLMFFVVQIFFREPRKAEEAPPPSWPMFARNFCVVVGNYRLVLPVLMVALLLRIAMSIYSLHVPWGIWVGLLVLGACGDQPVHVVPVLFTGYWVVFWQQYISLPGYHSRVYRSTRRCREDSGDGWAGSNLSYAGGELSDAQDSGIPGGDSRYGDHVGCVADPRLAADDLGRGAVIVCAGAGRDHAAAAILRIYFASGAAGAAGHIHGICISADGDWIADRRLVRRAHGSSFWRSDASSGANVVGDYDGRARHGGGVVDL